MVNDVDEASSMMLKESVLEEERLHWFAKEKECYTAIRESGRETSDIIATREIDEKEVLFAKTIFELASEKSSEDARKDKASNDESKDSDVRKVDYLTPFLPSNLVDTGKITKEEAKEARESCLRALKDRLLDRANIIQKRLDEENAQLAKRQGLFQRSRDHVEGADEEFEKFCHEAMFRIQILDQVFPLSSQFF